MTSQRSHPSVRLASKPDSTPVRNFQLWKTSLVFADDHLFWRSGIEEDLNGDTGVWLGMTTFYQARIRAARSFIPVPRSCPTKRPVAYNAFTHNYRNLLHHLEMRATSLHVEFPSEWSGWRGREYDLDLVPGSIPPSSSKSQRVPSDLHVKVEPKAIGDIYSDAPVFRGAIVQPRGFKDANTPWSKNTSVILKFALREDFIEDLVDEARMYAGPLQSLQGSVVPHVYGLYIGASEDGDPVACLALECWGEVIKQSFSKLPVDTRCVVYLSRAVEFNPLGQRPIFNRYTLSKTSNLARSWGNPSSWDVAR
ncbi:hypothetical protein CVT24_001218 [Panaeolus cyanescens]|uniref:Uncharacterized protein n=1 Tax=Panaeolus cyanescens TaxID=181874 RepID=A0A409VTP0_9AGAR|nr:hypothetical protein CVT24_001218 [Panaeolus cyanescens]